MRRLLVSGVVMGLVSTWGLEANAQAPAAQPGVQGGVQGGVTFQPQVGQQPTFQQPQFQQQYYQPTPVRERTPLEIGDTRKTLRVSDKADTAQLKLVVSRSHRPANIAQIMERLGTSSEMPSISGAAVQPTWRRSSGVGRAPEVRAHST